MGIGAFRIIHLLKEGKLTSSIHPQGEEAKHVFVLDSCQRKLWIDCDPAHKVDPIAPFEIYRGEEAYAFLLSVATGLESQVVGETDIFGQIKEAWKQQNQEMAPELKKLLTPWMQRLFEDTKEIRSLYLQNLGGSSYGSLLRKLLKDHDSLEKGPTLLIGAGQLARAVAPYLMDHELLISNRSVERAKELAIELQRQNAENHVEVIESFEEELKKLPEAAQVIICVPLDPVRDMQRVEVLRKSTAHIVHLGMRASECPEWSTLVGLHSLDELFQIEKSITATRSIQVEKARAACRERATLRFLGGGSASVSLGWEDLAAFGS